MKKITSLSMLSVLLFCTISAHAATFDWTSTPVTDSAITVFANPPAPLTGQALTGFVIFGAASANTTFTHTWDFNINPGALIAGFVMNFTDLEFASVTNPFSVTYDGFSVGPGIIPINPATGLPGANRQFNFNVNAAAGPHTIVIEGAIGALASGISPIYQLQIQEAPPGSQVTATPIPAAIWLFGSALLGVVGLSKRRKSLA